MLSDYDNLTLNFYDNKIEFDFSDVSIDDYDFIVLDICDARLLPSDSGSVLKYGPSFDNTGVTNGIQNQLSMSAASITYGEFFGEYDMHNSSDFTYLIDARSLASGVVEVLTYLDGVYCHKTVFEDITDITLKNFVINYHSIDKTYGNFSINAMYLYGFKNAEDCSLGAYISDTTLKLSDCKDSLLYTGE